MLRRIDELIAQKQDFAFETTLSTRSFVTLCNEVKQKGYIIYLVFLWLDSTELAIERVKQRVEEGGHNIPTETIVRRYYAGLKNFVTLYKDIVDYWLFFDNSKPDQELVAERKLGPDIIIYNKERWLTIQSNI